MQHTVPTTSYTFTQQDGLHWVTHFMTQYVVPEPPFPVHQRISPSLLLDEKRQG